LGKGAFGPAYMTIVSAVVVVAILKPHFADVTPLPLCQPFFFVFRVANTLDSALYNEDSNP
jgi:hypothetical protein